MGCAHLHVEIRSVAQDHSLGARPLAASLSPISPCSTGPFPGGVSQEKEVIPPCCRNWTPHSERCSARWKLCVGIRSVQGPWQLRKRSHLFNKIFSAQKEWQSRWDRTWNTWVKQWSVLDFWAFFNEILLHTLNVYLWKTLRTSTSNQSHGKWQMHSSTGKKPEQAVNPWQRLFYIWELICFFRADLNLVCCWVIRSGKLVSLLQWEDKSYVDWSPGASFSLFLQLTAMSKIWPFHALWKRLLITQLSQGQRNPQLKTTAWRNT